MKKKIISLTAEFTGQLMDAWGGRVLVTADHGQYENDGNGDPSYDQDTGIHGAFTSSDIFVPILRNWK